MTRRRGPRLAQAVVRGASLLVPASARGDWRREWEAEIRVRWDELEAASALTVAARADLLLRAGGSVVDAFFFGDGRWVMTGFVQDVRLAARSLVRRPGFSSVVILTLAVGIGANALIFSVARDVLLRPFGYPEPDRVVAVESRDLREATFSGNVTYPNVADVGAAATSFERIGVARWWVPALDDAEGSIVLRGSTVTANYFDILGVGAGSGRFFRPDEQGAGRPDMVVLSNSLWVERFGADHDLVGRDIRLSGVPYRVIGITSADFEDPWLLGGPGTEPQVWRTVASPPSEWPRSGRSWKGIGRLRSDVSLDVARTEIERLYAGLAETYPEENRNRSMSLTPLRERIAGPARPVLFTLLGAVAFLLLIACANLANLMLGRALDRSSEFSMHRALGAPAWRILRRAFAEAAILAGLGGAAGLGLALSLGGAVRRLGPMLPRPISGTVDVGVLAFTLSVTVIAGLLFGVVPAVQAARSGGALPGQAGARGGTLGRAGHRARRALVVTQMALATALLIGSGLLVRSFQRLGSVDLGLETAGVVSVDLHGSAWAGLDPEAAQAQWDAVLAAVRAVPTVEAAGAIDYVPFGGDYSCDGVGRDDLPPPEPGAGRCAEVRVVLPGALEAMGVTLLRGRMVDEADGAEAPPVAVIDERMADTFWPGPDEDPLGAGIFVHTRVHEVVAVVRDMRHFGPGGVVRPMIYVPAPQEGWNGISRGLTLIARASGTDDVVGPIRRAVADVNASIAIGATETLDGLLRESLAGARFRTGLMAAFGLTALLLAVLGIAGVMSYSVARRTRELGVRLALGARPAEVRRLVLREGVRLVGFGVVLGVVGAGVVAGALDSLLFGIGARDPIVYATVTVVLFGAAVVACYLPARRASRVDPISALSSG